CYSLVMNLSIRPVVAQYLFPCLMGVFSLSAQDNEYAAGLEEPVVLEAVHVHAEKGDQRSQAEQRLASIPGGVQLLPAERYLNGQAGNLADALRYAPGVYTGNEDGSQQVRLAVRGSGI